MSNKEPNWKKMVLHAMAERTGLYFICGEGREKEDKHYLPKYIHVCPAYGADMRTTVRYERIDTNDRKDEY